MGVPGSDLLSTALQVIETDTIQIARYIGRELNGIGKYETLYEEPVEYEASVQAVSRANYVYLGLDFNKRYVQVYVSTEVHDLNRDATSDKLFFNGKEFTVESNLDWFNIDGWVGLLCVQVVLGKEAGSAPVGANNDN